MVYKLVITKRAKYLFDNLIGYILYNLGNQQAAINLRKGIDKTLIRIGENPYQFRKLIYKQFEKKDYRGALVSNMNYIIVYRIIDDTVYIMGIFHIKEEFYKKI